MFKYQTVQPIQLASQPTNQQTNEVSLLINDQFPF